jgi:hypothetical protein
MTTVDFNSTANLKKLLQRMLLGELSDQFDQHHLR